MSSFRRAIWELAPDLALRGAGGASFVLHNAATWRTWHYVAWALVVVAGLEIWTGLVHLLGAATKARRIPARGKHLDALESTDLAFLTFNKLATAVFSYHLVRLAWLGGGGVQIAWGGVAIAPPAAVGSGGHNTDRPTLANTLGALMLLYVVYDFFYTLFHRALHHRSVYKYVHKHHHRQKAPSRGNADAINVHPFEFVSGEYNHLLALWIVSRMITPVHVTAVVAFILLGGFLASLNHTRFDLRFPLFPQVYQVRFHDIHHWYPDSNYGQYSMLWDRLFGWFKPYPSEASDNGSEGVNGGKASRNGAAAAAVGAAANGNGHGVAANGGNGGSRGNFAAGGGGGKAASAEEQALRQRPLRGGGTGKGAAPAAAEQNSNKGG